MDGARENNEVAKFRVAGKFKRLRAWHKYDIIITTAAAPF
jgi:hypothetical protein